MRKGKLYISFLLGLCLCLFTALFTSCKDEKPAPTLSTISVSGETEVFIDEFDYANYTITATYSDNSTKTATLSADNLSADDNAKLSTVGTHSLTVSYESATCSWTVTLKNHEFTGVTFDDVTTTYDGTAKTLAVSGLPTGAQVSYDKETSYTNAGEYTVTATVTLANYNPVELTATLTINKASYDMSAVAFADKTVTYNGESHSIEATNLPNGVTAEYTGNNQINAGEYEITATFTGDNQNYKPIADKTATLTIEKATIMGITFTGAEYTYDGKVKSLAIEGTLPDGVTVSYTGNNQTNAGEHPVTATFSKNANYNDLSDMQATLKIKKATYDMSAVVFKDKSVNYTGEAYSIEATNLPKGVSVRYDGNNKTQAGEYTVTAIFTGDSVNYNAIPNMTATLKISASDLTGISFHDGEFTYDGQPKSLAITGTLPDGVKVSYENNGQVNVDSYTVKATFTCTNGNYTNLPELTATLTIKKATYDMSGVLFKDKSVNYNGQAHSIEATNLPEGVSVRYDGNGKTQAGEYTVTAIFTGDSRNYNAIPNMTATLKINASDLTGISFNDGEFTYDGTKKSIFITGTLPEGVTVDYTNNEQINADSYTVKATFTCTNGNYTNLPELTATLTIKKAVYDMSAVIFADKTVTYDGQAHSIEATNLPQGVTAEYTGNKQINAGEYEITATFKGDSQNYELIASQTVTLTIEQRELTLAFNGETTLKYNGKAQKTITVQATNLVNGDSVGLTVSYNGEMIEAGEYIATATLTAHQNYKLTANNTVKVTITRAPHTVTFKQDGVADIVKEVLDLADLTDIPQPKAVDGYTFTWDRKDFTSITEDITVTAQKTLLTYKIEYVLNGGTNNASNPTTYTVESATFTLKAPTASETFGTTFGGWFTSPDFSLDSKITKIEKGLFGDLKLYAYWLEYRVTEVVGGAVDYSQATPEITIKVDYGTTNLAVKDLISVSDGCTWKLYTGFECLPTQELTAKRLAVSNIGDNIFYILVFHPDSDEYYTDYVLNVYQLDMKTYMFLKDGETWANGEIQEESALNAPENPEKDGYTFDGWKVNGEFVSFPYTVLTDTEFIAVYTPIEYTVTFKPNGGTLNQLTRTYTIETGMTFENPTREHYDFKGWYNGETQECAVTGIKIGTWGDFEFYAKWTPTVYRINYYLNGGSWTSSSTVSATYTIESPTITLQTPTKTGYTFAGWFTETTFENQATEIEVGSHGYKKFYAKWTPIVYSIEYELNGGENEESNPKTYTIVTATITLGNPTRSGYTFAGWFTEETFENQTTGIALGSYGNKKFYAKWTPTVYTIEYELNGGENEESNPETYSIETPTITLGNPTRAGYTFDGWYTDEAFKTIVTGIACGSHGNKTIYAKWEINIYYITYELNGYENHKANPEQFTILDLPITLSYPERTDYVLGGWYADEEMQDDCVYTISDLGDVRLYGLWLEATDGLKYSLSNKNYSITGYAGTNTSVVVPNLYHGYPVTNFGSPVFRYCSNLTEITLPFVGASKSATGYQAVFGYIFGCTKRSSSSTISGATYQYYDYLNKQYYHYYIPSSLKKVTITGDDIGDSAFSNCSSLTSVVIGDSVTGIGEWAFNKCSSLTSVYITDIEAWCNISFGNSSANPLSNGASLYLNNELVTELVIPNTVTGIKSYAFSGCSSLTSVVIPDSVTSIGSNAFRGCSSLTSVVIPDSVTSIGSYTFYNCSSLTSVVIGNGVTSIGSDAFRGCSSLTSIEIPDSVTSIVSGAFEDCSSLTSVVIGNGVTSIGSDAFRGCSSLTSIEIPDSVTSIVSGAFEDCRKLTSVVIGNGVTSIGFEAFYNCDSLTSIEIPDGVTSIGDYAFYSCSSLTSVVIGDGVTSIGYEAFAYCDSLTSVVIPDSVTSIDKYSFENCSSLTIYCEATSKPSGWESSWNYSNRPVVWGWTGEEYAYSFETNGGSTVENITSNVRVVLPTPTKDGWYFGGWYDNADLMGSPVSSLYYSATKTTLYAKWLTEEEYYDGSSFGRAIQAEVGGSYTVTIDTAGEKVYYKFTATESKSYTIKSSGGLDTYGYLYDSSQSQLTYNDGSTDFTITRSLTAGETYYVVVKMYSSSATGTFTLTIS